jgi:hypothetical protein
MSRVLAIGDIHTKLWIIDKVREIADNYDKIVFVGDYADDWGKQPIDTIDTWKKLHDLAKSNRNVEFIIGNHDYIYLHYTKTVSSGYNSFTESMLNEPDNKSLKDWLLTLPVKLDVDGVRYSHAGYTDTFNNEYTSKWLWEDNSPLWARPGCNKYLDYPQVFGHTPSKTCWEVQPNVWCIDTFSTYPDGTEYGDGTVLEVIDGKIFNKIKLAKDDNDSVNGIPK